MRQIFRERLSSVSSSNVQLDNSSYKIDDSIVSDFDGNACLVRASNVLSCPLDGR